VGDADARFGIRELAAQAIAVAAVRDPHFTLERKSALRFSRKAAASLGRNGGCRGVLAISLPVLAGRLYELTGDYETAVVVTGRRQPVPVLVALTLPRQKRAA
jgi:hypothetical protein